MVFKEVDFITSLWSDNKNDLIASLYSDDKIGAYALTSGTASDAKLCMERHRGRDGLICHFFSGSVIDQMTPGGTHTFLVAPGVWASSIIREFRDEVVVNPLFPEPIDEDFDSKFDSGVFGVIFEMPCRSALDKLKSLKPGCPYRLVRFTSVK